LGRGCRSCFGYCLQPRFVCSLEKWPIVTSTKICMSNVRAEAVLADRNVSNKLLAVESVRIRFGHRRSGSAGSDLGRDQAASTRGGHLTVAWRVKRRQCAGTAMGKTVRPPCVCEPRREKEGRLGGEVHVSAMERRQWPSTLGGGASTRSASRSIFVAGRATRIAQHTVPVPRLISESPIRCTITVVGRCRAATPSAVTSIPSAAPASAGRRTFADRPVG
jgi:hypothetical protein